MPYQDTLLLTKDLTDSEHMMFRNEFAVRRKEPTTGVLLCVFLGGLGAHRFWMGQVGLGILYACFVWTFIPTLVAFVECFLMSGRCREYNEKVAAEIVTRIKALRD